jgi:hypothetical protein
LLPPLSSPCSRSEIWFLLQPDVSIKPFATALRISSVVPDTVPPPSGMIATIAATIF